MAFFDELAKKIGDVADMAVDKAKDLTEVGRLNMAISSEEKQVQGLYAEIGKAIFEHDKENAQSPYAEQCVKIQAALDRIETLKVQLADVKENGYNEPIDIEPREAKEGTVEEAQPAGKTCPFCGKAVAEDSVFCSACGEKLQ